MLRRSYSDASNLTFVVSSKEMLIDTDAGVDLLMFNRELKYREHNKSRPRHGTLVPQD
jgi:hypothetical protein